MWQTRSQAQKSELSPINATLIGSLNSATFAPRACPGDTLRSGFRFKIFVRSPWRSNKFLLQITGVVLRTWDVYPLGDWKCSSGTREGIYPTLWGRVSAPGWPLLQGGAPPVSSSLCSSWESAILKQVDHRGALGRPQREIILACLQMLLESRAVSKWPRVGYCFKCPWNLSILNTGASQLGSVWDGGRQELSREEGIWDASETQYRLGKVVNN